MLKNSFFFILIILLSNCNSKDCFESSGEIIQKEVFVDSFSKIEVGNEISLILKQGTEPKVIIETGENLLDGISVTVTDNKLFLKDNNTCNFVRDYAITKIIVTAPNITEIRADTSRTISSEGVLEYPNLQLFSEDFLEDYLNIADFDLTINNQSLNIVSNGNYVFKIHGTTENLSVGFFAGSSRFEGKNLIANTINIKQKSSNDMLVYPIQKIEGTLYSTGNVISYHQPKIINVETYSMFKKSHSRISY